MAAPAAAPSSSSAQDATPERMAQAGVPFALALWYHLVGRHLTRFSEWDVERVMEVRLRLALASG